jgi:hypothetical protein
VYNEGHNEKREKGKATKNVDEEKIGDPSHHDLSISLSGQTHSPDRKYVWLAMTHVGGGDPPQPARWHLKFEVGARWVHGQR